MAATTPGFTVVMPVFNEQELIGDTVKRLVEVLADEPSYEIVLVDDGSSDQTWGKVRQLAQAHDMVRGVRFTRNFGHQAALRAGLMAASGGAVISMDSDGEHPPEVVPILLARWRAGAKVVQTVRQESPDLSTMKRATSRWFYRLFSWLADTPVRSGTADFRLLDRSVVQVLAKHPDASMFVRGFVPWSGFRTEFVPFERGTRRAGASKFTLSKMIRLARQGILGFSVRPLRLSFLLGAGSCCFAVVQLLYVLVVRLLFPEYAEPGWASVVGLVALLGGIQLLVIGVLGEYVGVLLETVRQQPIYIEDERVGFEETEQSAAEAQEEERTEGPPERTEEG